MENKRRILCLQSMFLQYTDDSHTMNIKRICNYLDINGYTATDKTVRDDILILQHFGMNIVFEKNKGYKLKSRLFELSELKMLADAISAFHFLTAFQAKMLLTKLETLCSNYEKREIYREMRFNDNIKSEGNDIFKNLDIINRAICQKKKIEFDYCDYDIKKNQVHRDGYKRICLPFATAMCSEQYYLVSNYTKYPETMTNFRIDRMRNIKILDEPCQIPPEKLNVTTYIRSSFSMFSGKSSYVTLKFPMENKFCNIVIDRFGKSVVMMRTDSNYFTICVPIKSEQPEPFFAWIFSFNGNVQITSPVDLREQYSKMLMDNFKKVFYQ